METASTKVGKSESPKDRRKQNKDRVNSSDLYNIRRYVFLSEDEVDRINRVMRYHSVDQDKDYSIHEFIKTPLMKEVDRLEKKYGLG